MDIDIPIRADPEVIAAGFDADNDVSAAGDFIATINTAIQRLVENYGQVFTPLTILSDPTTYSYTRQGNHLFTTTSETPEEFTELSRVLAMPEVGTWIRNTDLFEENEYRIIVRDADGHEVRTGSLFFA